MSHMAGMVCVGRTSTAHHADQVAGNDCIILCPANTLAGLLGDAAGSLQANSAANSLFTKIALGLHFNITIIGGFYLTIVSVL